ncbi:hypothetical protein [Vibrio sp. SCSIO 43137]|uniref:hypothetical protein n=1 Tax=Vibrio sp. SCSIO 43137 TaxID=3021011 RepID=UPI0023076421|nr:hypothetical protein [Vibrio sp. SCSIO 43137]WCE31043.1 hypothetical protein PK654_07200 [Vibrio sp. SCSIO 43137]
MSTQHQSRKDPHTIIVEARQICGGIASLASEAEGCFETLTGDQLYFLLSSLSDKLDDALEELELSDAA